MALAYHSVENIGIILIGLGASLVFIKGLLFLGAGSIALLVYHGN
ncbi:hypothetical protein [Phosphitispora fastidiosa]|nr:hypothetical protein [Phosphitispora fastidiosa]MBU7006547.1 formate hydrogenlyase subunit 3/multisubunit Na+/H+ antiporter MnhD subunit [Phosphitispora fastidiosa]